MSQYTTPTYEFFVRDARSLEFLGELHPDSVTATWTRRDIDAGQFRLTISRERAPLPLIALHNLIEIRRNPRDGTGFQQEFVGIIEARDLDPLGRAWTIEGVDLLGFWLSKRVVGADTASVKAGCAETVLKQYVAENLGAQATRERRAANELLGPTWDVERNYHRGSDVDFRALRGNLLTDVTIPVCLIGNVLQTVVLREDYKGYEYRTALPRDATTATGGVPFSVSWDNVEELGYREDYRPAANALYVLGGGAGEERDVTLVEKPESRAAHFRREATYDARDAMTESQRLDIGHMECDRQDAIAATVRGKPLRTSETARYRRDWDVGHDITVFIPQVEVQLDRRIVACTVALVRGTGEEITFELGSHAPESLLRKIVEKLHQLSRVASA